MENRWCIAGFVSLLLGTAGCALSEEASLDTSAELRAEPLLAANRISANRISANRISANRISANRISANRISANRIRAELLDGGELLSTAEGRELFGYLVSCALPEEDILEAKVDGTAYAFTGSIGLAPAWEHRGLTTHEERWISACLLARVNAHDVSVSISMRGPHEALAVSDEERARYDLEEGAFYGNVFTPEDEPIEWTACRGKAQAHGESGALVERDCAEPSGGDGTTECGFAYAGDCFDNDSLAACKRNDSGYYEMCRVPREGARRSTSTRQEVITVFVRAR